MTTAGQASTLREQELMEFTATLQDQAAANRAACVEREATVFDSVFSADGAFLISGAHMARYARCQPLGFGAVLYQMRLPLQGQAQGASR